MNKIVASIRLFGPKKTRVMIKTIKKELVWSVLRKKKNLI